MSETTKVGTNMRPRPPDPQSTSLFYTAAEVAYLLGMSYHYIIKNAGKSVLPKPVRVGRGPKWNREKFDRWVNDGCPKGAR